MRDLSRWRRPERIYTNIADIVAAPGEHIASVQAEGSPPLDAMVDFVGSDITFVSFHAAVSKESFSTPYFTGATLAARKTNRILVSDPSLSKDVLLAWFAGSRVASQDRINEFVLALVELAGAQHTVFFGGSGGGFAALNVARFHPSSTAVVANPQTDILQFYSRWWMPYARHCWGATGDEAEIADVIRARVAHDMVDVYGRTRPDVDVVYMQNRNDAHHLKNHLRPFMEGTGGRRVRLIEGDWGPGHARPPRERIVEVLDEVFESRRSGVQTSSRC